MGGSHSRTGRLCSDRRQRVGCAGIGGSLPQFTPITSTFLHLLLSFLPTPPSPPPPHPPTTIPAFKKSSESKEQEEHRAFLQATLIERARQSDFHVPMELDPQDLTDGAASEENTVIAGVKFLWFGDWDATALQEMKRKKIDASMWTEKDWVALPGMPGLVRTKAGKEGRRGGGRGGRGLGGGEGREQRFVL